MGRVLPFITCVLAASIANATVLVPAEFSEIVRGSEIIAYAKIVDARPEWADGRRWIDTVVTAEVVSSLKGSPGDTLTFKVPGGRLGRYQSVVVGAPVFARGDEAVLFLRTHGDELPDVFGLNQGVFRVVIDSRTGQRLVVPPPVMKIDASAEPERVVRGAVDRRPMAFDAFGARVAQVMAAKAAPSVRKSAR
jgi:hypothetical protein